MCGVAAEVANSNTMGAQVPQVDMATRPPDLGQIQHELERPALEFSKVTLKLRGAGLAAREGASAEQSLGGLEECSAPAPVPMQAQQDQHLSQILATEGAGHVDCGAPLIANPSQGGGEGCHTGTSAEHVVRRSSRTKRKRVNGD